jgi:Fanconi anemia group M protein
VEILNLDAGDYLIGDILIERKTAVDFIKSIVDGRLWNQLKKMSEVTDHAMLVVEGSVAYPIRKQLTKVHPNAVIGALSSVLVDWGIPVVVLPSYAWTAELLLRIHKKKSEPDTRTVMRARVKHKTITPDDELRRVVEGLPGIGANTAHELLCRFKTLQRLFSATKPELMGVQGIGEKRAAYLAELFRREYRGDKVKFK